MSSLSDDLIKRRREYEKEFRNNYSRKGKTPKGVVWTCSHCHHGIKWHNLVNNNWMNCKLPGCDCIKFDQDKGFAYFEEHTDLIDLDMSNW